MSTSSHPPKSSEPFFTRCDVARVLNVTPLTIANREKRGQYPPPLRDLNGYRWYSIPDVFHLQILTYRAIDPKPILSVLYDKGYVDPKQLGSVIDDALSKKGLSHG